MTFVMAGIGSALRNQNIINAQHVAVSFAVVRLDVEERSNSFYKRLCSMKFIAFIPIKVSVVQIRIPLSHTVHSYLLESSVQARLGMEIVETPKPHTLQRSRDFSGFAIFWSHKDEDFAFFGDVEVQNFFVFDVA